MVIFSGETSLGQTQLCLIFLPATYGSIWKNRLSSLEGFQSTSPEQIHFPKLYFICTGYFNFFLTPGGSQGQYQPVLNPLVQFVSSCYYVGNQWNTCVFTHMHTPIWDCIWELWDKHGPVHLRVPVFSRQHSNQPHFLSLRFPHGCLPVPYNFEEASFIWVTLLSSQRWGFLLKANSLQTGRVDQLVLWTNTFRPWLP